MPKGPNGEWRPAATGACAVHVAKLATGETHETYETPKHISSDETKKRASLGGKARAAMLTPERRREIASAGAGVRWRS